MKYNIKFPVRVETVSGAFKNMEVVLETEADNFSDARSMFEDALQDVLDELIDSEEPGQKRA